MTKYEEIDIGHLGDGPVLDMLQPGDVVTIKGPGERDLLVREVVKFDPKGRPTIAGLISPATRLYGQLVAKGREIVRVERPVPEELPTVPGYYVPSENLNETCPRVYGLGISGWWYSGVNGKVQEERMRELMPLARLVPETETAPAKLADRIDVAKLGGRMRSLFRGDGVWAEDAEALIAAIDNGELDK